MEYQREFNLVVEQEVKRRLEQRNHMDRDHLKM